MLYQHQIEAVQRVVAVLDKGGHYLLADECGLGKTRTAIKAASSLPISKILVVAPLSTYAGWRSECEEMQEPFEAWPAKDGFKKFTWINYDKLIRCRELFEIAWDMVVWDESHKLKSPTSQRHKCWESLRERCPRHLYLTATPGSSPLEMRYLCDVIGFSPYAYWPWVKSFAGIWKHPKFGGYKYSPHLSDYKRLSSVTSNPRAMSRKPGDIMGWPELQRVMHLAELTGKQRSSYEAAWDTYLRESGKSPKPDVQQLVRVGQFRKELSSVKVDHTVSLILEMMEQDFVCTVSCNYLHSAKDILDKVADARSGARVSIITGETPKDERAMILSASAKDEVDLVVFTVEEGINLHQVCDDHRKRVQIDHDIRWSPLHQWQIDGRTHRAGRSALVYWVTAHDTMDQRVASVLKNRLGALQAVRNDLLSTEELLYLLR